MKKIIFLIIVFKICFQNISCFAQSSKPNTKQKKEELLSFSKMQNDISLLESVIYNLHPGKYKFNSKEQIQQYFNQIKIDCNKQISIQDFYLKISQLVNKLKCGHTFPNPLNIDDSLKDKLFSKQVVPFFFKVTDDKLIITSNNSNNKAIAIGYEIMSINNYSSKQIIAKLLTVSRADGNNALHKKLSNINITPFNSYGNSLFDIYFPLFFPIKNDNLVVGIKSFKDKTTQTYTLNYTNAKDRLLAYEAANGKVPTDNATWEYKILKPNTAYLKFGTFAFWNSKFKWKNYIDSCINNINTLKTIQNLIIDLRGNEGGSGEIRDYILSVIATKPLANERNAIPCYSYLSIPDSLMPHLSTWDRSFTKPKDASVFKLNEIGLYESTSVEPQKMILHNSNNFKGNVYLLVDAVCSSATFGFAWTFKYNKLGTIVGETTGGTKRGLNGGEMLFFKMPNSKIEIDIPLINFYTKNVPDEGVKPDYEIKTTPLDIAFKKDSPLAYVLKMVDNAGK